MVRILLADDHLVIRGGLCALLKTRGSFSICAETGNGRDAVDLAIQMKPDIAIIDIDLPGLNGIEVTRQICREAPGTEVLIFTAERSEDVVQEAIRAGARGYLLKSAADDQIVEAINTLARHQAFYASAVSNRLLDNLTRQIRGNNDGVHLTMRERGILRMIAEGHSGKRIALLLGISHKTVETHRSAAMRKLQLRSVAAIVRYAVREKLIEA